MPNNRKISAKNIKLGDGVHPSSRKARQLTRSVARADRLKRNTARKAEVKTPRVERLLWFKDKIGASSPFLTRAQMHELVERYLARFDEELQTLKLSHRVGRPRPKAAREDAIKIVQSAESAEYAGGFELPDVTIPKVMALFSEWQGDLNYLDNIPMIRLLKEEAPATAQREARAKPLEPTALT